jgi:hypothetical protein
MEFLGSDALRYYDGFSNHGYAVQMPISNSNISLLSFTQQAQPWLHLTYLDDYFQQLMNVIVFKLTTTTIWRTFYWLETSGHA